MFNVNDGIRATYSDGKTYYGAVEKVRNINGRTLVTIAIPTTDYDDDGRPVNVWEYRSLYLDKCISVDHISPQEV